MEGGGGGGGVAGGGMKIHIISSFHSLDHAGICFRQLPEPILCSESHRRLEWVWL